MTDGASPLPPKKDVAFALLEGSSMFVHLDPRKPEVMVPPHFKKQHQLVLQVGLNMAIAIPDLRVDDEGVTCTLSFNRSPFWCKLPWTSVYALVGEDGRGMVWPSEVPPEVASQVRPPSAKPVAGPTAVAAPPVAAQVESTKPKKERRRPATLATAATKEGGESSRNPVADADAPGKTAALPFARAQPDAAEANDRAMGRTSERPTIPPPADPNKKGRRELPPYLRVVK